MTDLAKFQDGFGQHLLGDNDLPPGLTGSEANLRRRLSVYRNNVFYSLTTALGDLYPVVKQLVGEEFFRHLARQYLLKHPPQRASMVHLGEDFPAYLERDELQTGLTYLAEVARLELARHQSFHAADAVALEPEAIRQIGVEKLLSGKLVLHPSLRLLKSAWAIRSIWAAHQSEQVDLTSVRLDQSESVLILRMDTKPLVYAVEPPLLEMLLLLEEGSSLSDAIADVADNYPAFDAATALAFCIDHGIFIDYNPDK